MDYVDNFMLPMNFLETIPKLKIEHNLASVGGIEILRQQLCSSDAHPISMFIKHQKL